MAVTHLPFCSRQNNHTLSHNVILMVFIILYIMTKYWERNQEVIAFMYFGCG